MTSERQMILRIFGLTTMIIALAGCASVPPRLPYPAFIQVDSLEDVFMASLPGVRAKQLAGDPQTRRTSNRIDLPPDWKGTSGGVPGRSMEIFVLQGELMISDITMRGGSFAFLPAGSLGFNLSAPRGARILYFVNDSDPDAVIRSPIIMDSGLLEWEATQIDGVQIKKLRDDPGSGAKTWLTRVTPGAAQRWETSTANREGYLLAGSYQHSECVNGKIRTSQYAAGGYFNRPANTISGGPKSLAKTDSVWLLRETAKGETAVWPSCVAAEVLPP